MKKIIPVLLSGGEGTRLWPLSRKNKPKQFIRLNGEISLFQQTALRVRSSDLIKLTPPIVVTGSATYMLVLNQLDELKIKPLAIIVEPTPKNTSAAILAACRLVLETHDDALLWVVPCDHSIDGDLELHEAIKIGLRSAEIGNVVTFGVKPTSAETGYGYLRVVSSQPGFPGKVNQFVEKPDKTAATEMFNSGEFHWNSGIFLFAAGAMVKSFEDKAKKISNAVFLALKNAKRDNHLVWLENDSWAICPSVSIDYSIIEKIDNLYSVPLKSAWADLGSWQALYDKQKTTNQRSVKTQNTFSENCEGSLLWSEVDHQLLVGFGIKNVVAVATDDAILVADRGQTGNLTQLVSMLKAKGKKQAEHSNDEFRPWGGFESIFKTEKFHIKKITVKPESSLSLQSHQFRSEHWIVLKGEGKVQIGENSFVLQENESTFIPAGAKHRLENETMSELEILEIQIGTCFSEDDIIRYEDAYGRV